MRDEQQKVPAVRETRSRDGDTVWKEIDMWTARRWRTPLLVVGGGLVLVLEITRRLGVEFPEWLAAARYPLAMLGVVLAFAGLLLWSLGDTHSPAQED